MSKETYSRLKNGRHQTQLEALEPSISAHMGGQTFLIFFIAGTRRSGRLWSRVFRQAQKRGSTPQGRRSKGLCDPPPPPTPLYFFIMRL